MQPIPDIHVGRAYDQRDPEGAVHYETFARLANFFGRNIPAHRHYGFFQVHFLLRGTISLNLDGQTFCGQAPLLIFTPPTIPHSFYTEEESDDHVLTVRQETVRQWYQAMPGQWPDSLLRQAAFCELGAANAQEGSPFTRLRHLMELLQQEFLTDSPGRASCLQALGQSFFIHLSRLLVNQAPTTATRQDKGEDLRLFFGFCDLFEQHFREHLTLSEYARRLSLTEARLTDICRRMANRPPKEMIHERLLQEARRLLQFSAIPVSEISYQLGFADPAYFSRFFTKRCGTSPSKYRRRTHP